MAALGLAETVEIRAWLSPPEVQQLLADADVFVLPSLSEGQPMAVLEAMATACASLPVMSAASPR